MQDSEVQESACRSCVYIQAKKIKYNVLFQGTDLLGPWLSGGALRVLVHPIQQPEQELQGVVLGVALELGAVLGNSILKGEEKTGGHLGLPPPNQGPFAPGPPAVTLQPSPGPTAWRRFGVRSGLSSYSLPFGVFCTEKAPCFPERLLMEVLSLGTHRVVPVEYFDSVDHLSSLITGHLLRPSVCLHLQVRSSLPYPSHRFHSLPLLQLSL